MPVSAAPDPSYELSAVGVGTAELSTEQKHGGSYSIKLFMPNGAPTTDYGAVIVHYGKSFSTIPTVASAGTYEVVDVNKLYFWVRLTATIVPPAPYIILDLDTDGDGQREYALISVGTSPTAGGSFSLDTWTKGSPRPDSDGVMGGINGWMGWDVGASAVVDTGSDTKYEPLGYWKTTAPYSTATVLNIKIWYGEWSAARIQGETAYVDDLTVDTFTCDFEEGPSVSTATGTGSASFTITTGNIGSISAVGLATLPQPVGGLQFPHGLFTFRITGLTPGATVTVTITLPSAVPVGTSWHKYHASVGISLPIGSDDGDNVVTVTITDDGTGDFDLTDGVILDPGGPAYYEKEVGGEILPVDKLALLAPYIAAIIVMATVAVVIRRRRY